MKRLVKVESTGESKTLIKTLDGEVKIRGNGKEYQIQVTNEQGGATTQASRKQLELLHLHLGLVLEIKA